MIPTKKGSYFPNAASSFVSGKTARVLLQMPSCREVFVNLAHRREFRQKFATVSEVMGATRALNRFRASTIHVKDERCYCYPIDAIVALVAKHCVFERNFKSLPESASHPSKDLSAILLSQDGARRYQLYLTRCQRFGDGAKLSFLDAEFIKLLGLEVVVETVCQNPGKSLTLRAKTELDGRMFLPPITREVADKGYNAVFSAFSLAIQRLEESASSLDPLNVLHSVKASLLTSISSHKTHIDYEAVAGFIHGIFNCGKSGSRKQNLKKVVREFRRVQERLYDAHVVVDIINPMVLGSVLKWPVVGALR